MQQVKAERETCSFPHTYHSLFSFYLSFGMYRRTVDDGYKIFVNRIASFTMHSGTLVEVPMSQTSPG